LELKTAGSAFILHFDPLFTIAIASLVILLGINIRNKSVILEHLCLPVALIGGAFVVLARIYLYFFYNTEVTFDISLLPYFFLVFFAAIGLYASIPLIKNGGMTLTLCVTACWGMSVIQNLVGIGMARLFEIHPTFGVLAGATSLAGGHGSALAFGFLIESHGIMGAEAVGLAAATFGVLAGSILGAPLGKYLIARHNLKIETTQDTVYSQHIADEETEGLFDSTKFLRMFSIVFVCMALGSWIGGQFDTLLKDSPSVFLRNFTFPEYVWVMLIAVIIRNIGDAANIIKGCADSLGLILNLSLRYAVAFVVMSLSVTELHDIALPLTMILFTQTLIVVLVTKYAFFSLLGKDYDAAVICAGLCGLLLGASHSAMSNISTVCEQHNKIYSQKAFLVVSLCGAVLLDIFMLPFSSVCISIFL
jgi:ESS family glutamate:Na+ symporter